MSAPAPLVGLTAMQAAGLACVTCGTPYDIPPPIDHVPVGTTPDGRQVFACESRCAPALGYVPPVVQLEIGASR